MCIRDRARTNSAISHDLDVNPYSSPKADLGSVVSASEKLTIMQTLFSLQGRIPRRVFWGYSFCAYAIFYGMAIGGEVLFGPESVAGSVILMALVVPFIWTVIALQCKRWHDRDKSGWHYFISWIPLIGGIWVFVELGCLRGTEGQNRYGEDPT